MKTNEAPDKIYVTEGMLFMTNPEITLQGNGNKIEYTRTDAFIEKVKKAMIEWAGTYVSKTGKGVKERKALAVDLLTYFEKYMGG